MSRRADGDGVVASAREEIKVLVAQFTYDLALLIAGHEVDFGLNVDSRLGERLRAAAEPMLAAGAAMAPNFGEYARLSIRGNLRGQTGPVTAVVTFHQRSALERADRIIDVPRARRMRLELKLVREPWRITDYRLLYDETGAALGAI